MMIDKDGMVDWLIRSGRVLMTMTMLVEIIVVMMIKDNDDCGDDGQG